MRPQPSTSSQSVIDGIHLFQGVTDSTMSHGEGWQFIQLGRYIERASADRRRCSMSTASSGTTRTVCGGKRVPRVDRTAALLHGV